MTGSKHHVSLAFCKNKHISFQCVFISAKGPTVQKLALAAKRTYNDDSAKDVNLIASLGSYGMEPQNITPFIMERFCKNTSHRLPEPSLVKLPMRVKDMAAAKVTVEMKDQYVFLPHDWLCNMEDVAFETIWGLESLQPFWDCHSTAEDPCCRKLRTKLSTQKVIPLNLHGDGAQFQREGSLMVISMRSLLTDVNVGHSQMLLAAVPKICVAKSANQEEDTMKTLWRIFAWSFESLFQGKHPMVNYDGKPFLKSDRRYALRGKPLKGNNICATIFVISGDNEYFQNELKLPGYSSSQCCKDCKANKSDIPHNDYRATAKWRSTLKTPAQNDSDPPSSHPILNIAGVVPEMIQYDTLHVIEEGCSTHAIANCIFDFVIGQSKSFAGTQENKLATLNKKIMELQASLHIDAEHRARPLAMSSFCTVQGKHTHFPELHGIKARHIRYLVPVIAEICKQEYEPAKIYTYHRMKMMEHLNAFCKIIDEADFHHFTRPESDGFTPGVLQVLAHYTKCSKMVYDGGARYRYNTITKFHNLAHMLARAVYLNPRSCSTYTGETMVGFVATLAHSCLNGTPSHLISHKLCWRWRLGLDLRLQSD